MLTTPQSQWPKQHRPNLLPSHEPNLLPKSQQPQSRLQSQQPKSLEAVSLRKNKKAPCGAFLLCQQSDQSQTVYCSEQDVVSQHAKRLPSPSSPSIHGTAKDPSRIKSQKRRVGHCERHSNAATNADSPSKQLNNKANWVRVKVTADPINCVAQHTGRTLVHWQDSCPWPRLRCRTGQ